MRTNGLLNAVVAEEKRLSEIENNRKFSRAYKDETRERSAAFIIRLKNEAVEYDRTKRV
jgi:hypothetical protein